MLRRRRDEHLCVLNENEEAEWIDIELLEESPEDESEEPPSRVPIIHNVADWVAKGVVWSEE